MRRLDRGPVVDMCGIFFDDDCWAAYLGLFAERAPGYLGSFTASLAPRAGVEVEDLRLALQSDPHHAVDVLLSGRPLDPPVERHVANLQSAGIVRQVIHGVPRLLPDGTSVNTRMAQVIAPHRDVLELWPGLDVGDIEQAIAELERCTLELGTRGASIVHWWGRREPRDPECHALYARAEELGVPLWIHTGTSFAANHPFDYCTWGDIDHIAVHHPGLTIVAGHGGWPRVLDGIAVLQRHRNVFLDFSAHRPRYMRNLGGGWEPLLLYGRNVVRDQIVFGSVTWVHTATIGELVDEVWELGLGEATTRPWLHGNAQRLLDSRAGQEQAWVRHAVHGEMVQGVQGGGTR